MLVCEYLEREKRMSIFLRWVGRGERTFKNWSKLFFNSLQLHSYTAALITKCLNSDHQAKTPNQARAHDCHGDCRFRLELVPILFCEHHRHHPGYQYADPWRGRNPGFACQGFSHLQPHRVHCNEWQVPCIFTTCYPLFSILLKGLSLLRNQPLKFKVSWIWSKYCRAEKAFPI